LSPADLVSFDIFFPYATHPPSGFNIEYTIQAFDTSGALLDQQVLSSNQTVTLHRPGMRIGSVLIGNTHDSGTIFSSGFGLDNLVLAVPEPASASLLAMGLAGVLAGFKRRHP
jgi:hypothetical protein